jgi:hypothetical protein
MLENEELFRLVFDRSELRAYQLSENFTPPPQQQSFSTFFLAASYLQPPPEKEEPLALKLLLLPVYTMSGGAKFVVGVPITVLM